VRIRSDKAINKGVFGQTSAIARGLTTAERDEQDGRRQGEKSQLIPWEGPGGKEDDAPSRGGQHKLKNSGSSAVWMRASRPSEHKTPNCNGAAENKLEQTALAGSRRNSGKSQNRGKAKIWSRKEGGSGIQKRGHPALEDSKASP